jgi:hypothetical protein
MSIHIAANIALLADEIAEGGLEPPGITPENPRIGWHNIVTASNISAGEEAAGFPLVNLANPTTYLRWRAETDYEQELLISEAAQVNYFAIAGHNLGQATLTFQSSDNLADWTTHVEVIPGSNNAYIAEFENATAGYFRLLIAAPVGTVPEIAVLHVGRILRVQRRIYVGHRPITLSRRTKVSTGKSENGQFIGRVLRSQGLSTDIKLSNLTPSWYRDFFDPFVDHATTGAFFWAWRPQSYPNEVGYTWLTADISPPNQRRNGMMEVALSVDGHA